MKKMFSVLMMLSLSGCGFFNGPSSADIEAIARQEMISSAPNPAAAEIARNAKIAPKGLCNHMKDGTYACMVEVNVGPAPQTFVVEIKKDGNGKWVPAK